ncbi:P-loop NTPase fold protein [Mycobacterium sp. HNNTM2301]|uniref:KAP family P-loop NTPase fold protein n=1 Tax=Mycobacterium hainanense TaxID=3289775 RepID=UPI0035A71555
MTTAADNAIRTSAEDLLDRTVTAATLVRAIQTADSTEGYVLAVVGPWGSGKTSILNLMQEQLEREETSTVIKFNPWMFSGTEQLVDAFFRELGAQLRETGGKKFDKIATAVDKYSFLFRPLGLIPGAGGYIDRAVDFAKGVKKYADSKKPSINSQRRQLQDLLSELDSPIIMTVDDIDRLSDDEIRAIFKLVRLTGNFPNLIYVLAFDRQRVEMALTGSGLDGKAYVEKIVQHGIRVPELSTPQIANLLTDALNDAMREIDKFPYFERDRWMDIQAEIILPLVHTMRDVRRYAVAASTAAFDFNAEFNLTDVLALEAIRVFAPSKFDAIARAREALTAASDLMVPGAADIIRQLVNGEGDENVTSVMTALVNRVFPLASHHLGGQQYSGTFAGHWLSQWLIERRLAHGDLLGGYLEYKQPDIITDLANADLAFGYIEDAEELGNFLRSLTPARCASTIDALRHYEKRFAKAAVLPASTVLLNLMGELPKDENIGLFGLQPSDIAIIRVKELLRVIHSQNDAYDIVRGIMANVGPLSSQLELIRIAGNRLDFGGEGILTDEQTKELETEFSMAVGQATSEEFATEWGLLKLLSVLTLWGYDLPPCVLDFTSPLLHRRLLEQAQSGVQSVMVGNRAVYIATRLRWDDLKRVYGTEEAVGRGIDAAATTLTGAADEFAPIVELAKKYLAGEMPDDDR